MKGTSDEKERISELERVMEVDLQNEHFPEMIVVNRRRSNELNQINQTS